MSDKTKCRAVPQDPHSQAPGGQAKACPGRPPQEKGPAGLQGGSTQARGRATASCTGPPSQVTPAQSPHRAGSTRAPPQSEDLSTLSPLSGHWQSLSTYRPWAMFPRPDMTPRSTVTGGLTQVLTPALPSRVGPPTRAADPGACLTGGQPRCCCGSSHHQNRCWQGWVSLCVWEGGGGLEGRRGLGGRRQRNPRGTTAQGPPSAEPPGLPPGEALSLHWPVCTAKG